MVFSAFLSEGMICLTLRYNLYPNCGKFPKRRMGDKDIYTIFHLFFSLSNLLPTEVDYKLFQHINPILCFLSPIWASIILRIWALDRFLQWLIRLTSPFHSFIISYCLSGSFSVIPIKGQSIFLCHAAYLTNGIWLKWLCTSFMPGFMRPCPFPPELQPLLRTECLD